MLHSELLEKMANDLGGEKAAREALDAFISAVWLGLHRDGKVEIRDLGVIAVRDTPARKFRDIHSGELRESRPSKQGLYRLSAPLRRSLKETMTEKR